MDPQVETADPTSHALRTALLDYCKAPGKYQVTQRQPSALFAALREILQISVGREGVAIGAAESLRDAARFFIRTGLLYPGADHYALMGLERKVENAELKDRYRLMMRLLHPDFAGPNAGKWPADAAVRVNRAYDVLSSPVRRKEYDEQRPQAITTGAAPLAQRKAGVPPKAAQSETRETRFKKLAVGFAVAAGVLIVVAMFATGTSDTAQLVQRIPIAAAPVGIVRQETLPSSSDSPALAPATKLAAAPISKQLVSSTQPAPSPRQAVRVAAQATAEIRPAALQLAFPSKVADVPVYAPAPAPLVPQQSAVAPPPAPAPAPALIEAWLEIPVPLPIPVAIIRPVSRPAPTLKEAQPLLTQLLQLMEGGQGDRILNLLDVDARNKPSAQALSRQYDSLVDGARPVRLSHVEFKAQQADGRLLVIGQFRLIAGEQTIGSLGKRMVLRAEFASREGNVVITGLSSGADN
jgi:hypothetical protein